MSNSLYLHTCTRKGADLLYKLGVLAAPAYAAYTPAWRTAGLPAKASQLSMDPCWLSGSQLLDPAAIMARHRAQQQKEVVQPPAMFEYCNKEGDPHYLQETGNLKVWPDLGHNLWLIFPLP